MGVESECDRIKGPWSPEEDEALQRLVARHGARNWSLISRSIPGRSGKSCRLRWRNQLSPDVHHRPFTPREDALILAAHARYGNKWATIARYLHGRSDNAVKNRWNSALRKAQQGSPAAAAQEVADDAAEDQAAAPACLDLFPLRAGEMREANAADRLGVREEDKEAEEEDAASIGLTLGSPGLSDAELALSLGPVRPPPNRGVFRLFL